MGAGIYQQRCNLSSIAVGPDQVRANAWNYFRSKRRENLNFMHFSQNFFQSAESSEGIISTVLVASLNEQGKFRPFASPACKN